MILTLVTPDFISTNFSCIDIPNFCSCMHGCSPLSWVLQGWREGRFSCANALGWQQLQLIPDLTWAPDTDWSYSFQFSVGMHSPFRRCQLAQYSLSESQRTCFLMRENTSKFTYIDWRYKPLFNVFQNKEFVLVTWILYHSKFCSYGFIT